MAAGRASKESVVWHTLIISEEARHAGAAEGSETKPVFDASDGRSHDRDLIYRLLKLSPRQRLDELGEVENFFRKTTQMPWGLGQ